MSTDPNYRADVIWPEHERGRKPARRQSFFDNLNPVFGGEATPPPNPDAPLLARLETMLADVDVRNAAWSEEDSYQDYKDATNDAAALRRVIGLLKTKEGGKV